MLCQSIERGHTKESGCTKESGHTSGSDLLDSFHSPPRTTTLLCDTPVIKLDIKAAATHSVDYCPPSDRGLSSSSGDDCALQGQRYQQEDTLLENTLQENTAETTARSIAIERLARTLRSDRSMILVGDDGLQVIG